MAQASGAAAQILIVKETTFGVTPATPQYKLLAQAVYGESLNSQSEQIVSNVISAQRGQKGLRSGLKSGDGAIPFEMTTEGSDLILEGLAGQKTGTGATATPFVYKRFKTLPSFSIEKGLTDVNQYFTLKGFKVNTLELNVEPGQIVSGSVSFLGKGDPSVATTSADATPDVIEPVSFTGIDAKVMIDGVEATTTSFTMSITNDLTSTPVLHSAYPYSINVGRGSASGNISIVFEDNGLFAKWLAETEGQIDLVLEYDGKTTTFSFPRVKYTGAGVPNIESAEGVVYTLAWSAIVDITEGSDFVITQIVSA